jgi:hypothetical protein
VIYALASIPIAAGTILAVGALPAVRAVAEVVVPICRGCALPTVLARVALAAGGVGAVPMAPCPVVPAVLALTSVACRRLARPVVPARVSVTHAVVLGLGLGLSGLQWAGAGGFGGRQRSDQQ